MKQYVLDEPVAVAAPPPVESQLQSLTQPGWWRWLLLAILLEPVALAILYLALNGVPVRAPRAPSRGVAYVASFSFPREAASSASAGAGRRGAGQPCSARSAAATSSTFTTRRPPPPWRCSPKRRSARRRQPHLRRQRSSRLTRSVVATSPREAWQAVFGDVANFAIACASSACEVRFVSLAKPGAPMPRPEVAAGRALGHRGQPVVPRRPPLGLSRYRSVMRPLRRSRPGRRRDAVVRQLTQRERSTGTCFQDRCSRASTGRRRITRP